LKEAAAARAQAVGALAEARAKTARLGRAPDPGDDDEELAAHRRRHDRLAQRAEEAREAEAAAARALAESLAAKLADEEADDAAGLAADVPVVLLPVRIETRFAEALPELELAAARLADLRPRPELFVRIYPDDIHATTHEAGLTENERVLGERFWRAAWPDEAAERDAWRILVAQMPAPRAAYVTTALTPDNLAARPAGEPTFPDVPARGAAWSEAVLAGCLPDRFQVIAYRGPAIVHRAVSRPVRVPLALSLAPDEGVAATPVGSNGPELDDAVRWTVEFEQALEAGMAVRIPLDPRDLELGFDTLVVVGVSSTRSPAAAADDLAALIGAHRFGRGLAFVRQGTPTNNSDAAGSGYPPADPQGARSFAVERGGPLAAAGTDGELMAEALGLDIDAFAHVEGAERQEQRNARAMAWALWPATLGYFMEQMADPVFDADAVGLARRHMADFVRGRGPLPALRVGAVPYGVLPVTSLARYAPLRPDAVDRVLPEGLRRLLPFWQRAIEAVPRMGRTGDPDRDLLETLGMDAATQEVRVRRLHGEDLERNLRSLFGFTVDWSNPAKRANRELLEGLGVGHWWPRIEHGTFAPRALPFAGPLVTSRELSETETLAPNYIAYLRGTPFLMLRFLQRLEEDDEAPALLYLLLRHGALTEVRMLVLETAGVATREREVVGVGRGQEPSMWEHLEVLPQGGAVSLQSTTAELPVAGRFEVAGRNVLLADYDAALGVLEGLPTAELQRLLTETLDVCSHRLDAWVTSLATKRLAEARAGQAVGCHLGAYGWVEDVRPRDDAADNAGYVHAPSMAHAATAAILRNAWRSRRGTGDAQRYAVDLSSARVRTAMELLEAVRNGQPLAAVLGYRFERGLHEGHPGLSLDRYIEPFRLLYPLVPSRLPETDEPGEAMPARDVVHALNLRTAFAERTVPFGSSGLPAPGSTDHAAVVAELRALDDAVDAVADLVLAEGVHQLVRGNVDASAAAFDAFTGEGRPPTPEVASVPRSGIGLAHRVAVVLGDGGPGIPPNWPAATPRATAEPALDAWVGTLLGDPRNVRCVASWRAPTAADPNARATREVTLDQLGLRPLDVMALARAGEHAGAGAAGTIDRVISLTVAAGQPEPTDVEIAYARAPGWDHATVRTFPEVLDLARSLGDLVGGARPLAPADLVPPGEAPEAPDLLAADAVGRAADARDALETAANNLAAARAAAAGPLPLPAGTLDALRGTLADAVYFGVPEAVPSSGTGETEALRAALLAQADTSLAEMERRVEAADDALATAAAAADDAARVAAARAAAEAVFGTGFTFVPRFEPGSTAALAAALAAAPGLVGSAAEVRVWAAQAARVRVPLERWHLVEQTARALGANPPSPTPVQLPHKAGEPWVAGPLPPPPAEPPPAGRLSLVLHRAAAPAAEDAWAGLLLDEWTEVIPSTTETTAVSFHFDSPGAAAPGAVLVAVHPTAAERWDTGTLLDILRETLELAKVRAVDSELLAPLGQFLPALVMAGNVAADTVSTLFGAFLAEEATIRGAT
jgi:hypothetical protein